MDGLGVCYDGIRAMDMVLVGYVVGQSLKHRHLAWPGKPHFLMWGGLREIVFNCHVHARLGYILVMYVDPMLCVVEA